MSKIIFVSIASYRDSELASTIEDLLAKAAKPDRVYLCVHNQIQPQDNDCKVSGSKQLKVIESMANKSLGVCWARHKIQKELPVEADYFLQIDSHMRFAKNWDCKMIDMLTVCPSNKPVLSCYPVGYTPPHKLGEPIITRLKPNKFNHNGILALDSEVLPISQPTEPQSSGFVAGGFIFASASAFREVIYDPYLYFIGEEVTFSARLWTHGWDFFAPNYVLIYHNYRPTNRPRHWDDNTTWQNLNRLSVQRVKFLLTGELANDQQALSEIEIYGLGNERTLKAYEQFCGVDFVNQTIYA